MSAFLIASLLLGVCLPCFSLIVFLLLFVRLPYPLFIFAPSLFFFHCLPTFICSPSLSSFYFCAFRFSLFVFVIIPSSPFFSNLYSPSSSSLVYPSSVFSNRLRHSFFVFLFISSSLCFSCALYHSAPALLLFPLRFPPFSLIVVILPSPSFFFLSLRLSPFLPSTSLSLDFPIFLSLLSSLISRRLNLFYFAFLFFGFPLFPLCYSTFSLFV